MAIETVEECGFCHHHQHYQYRHCHYRQFRWGGGGVVMGALDCPSSVMLPILGVAVVVVGIASTD